MTRTAGIGELPCVVVSGVIIDWSTFAKQPLARGRTAALVEVFAAPVEPATACV